MPQQADVNALLRFLTQDAKLALPNAMAATRSLQAHSLTSISLIATSNLATLTPIFACPDDAKKVFNASKRVSKRAASGGDQPSPRKKRRVSKEDPSEPGPEDLEAALALPQPVTNVDQIASTVLFTNRAPLLLVFTLVLLEYTMPRQPLSSRLSLAQAQVSHGARERARDLGIEKGPIAEEDGWGTGQPIVKVMSKDIRVIRRPEYPLAVPNLIKVELGEPDVSATTTTTNEQSSVDPADTTEIKVEEATASAEDSEDQEIALWALDLEALKKANNGTTSSSAGGLPIYSPHSARAYIVKAFAIVQPTGTAEVSSSTEDKLPKAKNSKSEAKQREDNLGLLLGALRLLFEASAGSLDSIELSRRAWGWYVSVRPDVEHGPAGWGNKGEVSLQKILDLRK